MRKAARALAEEGKAIVWIDGGLHATETLGAHQLTRTIHMLASATDAETLRFLDDVIVLLVHANPDGMELVSDWYMRKSDPEERGYNDIPRLYQKYIGHDNNRDSYMVEPAGDGEHEPDHVPRMVPADDVQPSSNRACRHYRFRATVSRSAKPELRSAGDTRQFTPLVSR